MKSSERERRLLSNMSSSEGKLSLKRIEKEDTPNIFALMSKKERKRNKV